MKIQAKDGVTVEALEAEILWATQHAEAIVEDALQELFDGPWETYKAKNYNLTFHSLGVDEYDHSIELYVSEDAKFDEEALTELLRNYGFTFGWINFDDGSEIHFNTYHPKDPIFYPRAKKEHPHYTKEMKDEKHMGYTLSRRPAFRRFLKQERKD